MRTIKLSIIFMLALIISIFSPGYSNANPLENWHWRNPLPQGNALNSVTYGNGTYVAVGQSDRILTSPNGLAWTAVGLGALTMLTGITYANNTFVTIGESGIILSSPNGIVWTDRNSGTLNNLRGVAYGNSTFVAVGGGGTILTSPDGAIWTSRESGTNAELTGVTYGNDTFVVVSYTGIILTSHDGAAWAFNDSYSYYGQVIAYGNGIFVAADYLGFHISTDGITWTYRSSGTYMNPKSMTYGNGIFIAVGAQDTIVTSSDGETWVTRNSNTNHYDGLNGIIYGDNNFVAVGYGGIILSSINGIDWTIRRPITPNRLNGIAYINNTFVTVGESGIILTSSDGIVWKKRHSVTSKNLHGVAYGNGTFVAVGEYHTILTSRDGIVWTERSYGNDYHLFGITFGNGIFVAVGGERGIQGGVILTSSNGIVWAGEIVSSDFFDWDFLSGLNLYDVIYINGTFVAVGGGWFFKIFTSNDGIVWTKRISEGSCLFCPLTGITYGNGTFVAVGYTNSSPIDPRPPDFPRVFTSQDTVTWKSDMLNYLDQVLNGITYGNSTFVAVGSIIITSPDGFTWIKRNLGSVSTLNGIAYGDDTFVAVGEHGTIIQSAPNVGPDLTGTWTDPPIQICKNTTKGPKCTITGTLTVKNIGSRDASSSTVKIYLSDDDTYDQSDTPLKPSITGKIKAGQSKTIKLTYNFPVEQIVTNKYIIAVIDKYNSVVEVDEANNVIIFGPIQ